MKTKLSISFDFDSTLTEKPIQWLAKGFVDSGIDVYITTSRANGKHNNIDYKNEDLFIIAKELGIKEENIIFTSYEDKAKFVKDFDMHFDDDEQEIFLINSYPNGKCIGLLYEENNNSNTVLN